MMRVACFTLRSVQGSLETRLRTHVWWVCVYSRVEHGARVWRTPIRLAGRTLMVACRWSGLDGRGND